MNFVLDGYVIALGWIIALVICMGVAIPILIWIIDKLVVGINIAKELKKKNIAVAIVLASVIIGFSMIVSLVIS